MTPDTSPQPDPNPTTRGYRTEFFEFVSEGVELTPEVLAMSRLGRPDPSPHLELALQIEEELKREADRKRASAPPE